MQPVGCLPRDRDQLRWPTEGNPASRSLPEEPDIHHSQKDLRNGAEALLLRLWARLHRTLPLIIHDFYEVPVAASRLRRQRSNLSFSIPPPRGVNEGVKGENGGRKASFTRVKAPQQSVQSFTKISLLSASFSVPTPAPHIASFPLSEAAFAGASSSTSARVQRWNAGSRGSAGSAKAGSNSERGWPPSPIEKRHKAREAAVEAAVRGFKVDRQTLPVYLTH